MAKPISPTGPWNARIAIVGEGGNKWEGMRGEPFVGPYGQKLDSWLNRVHLDRSEIYFTNVVDVVLPPSKSFNDMGRLDPEVVRKGQDTLHNRMAELDDPFIIVPMGNVGLDTLTGAKGITKYRGSILSYTDLNERTIKVIPTLHPGSIYHDGHPARAERHIMQDLERIAEESKTREIVLPSREHIVFPSEKEIKEFYNGASKADSMSIDIETAGGAILCVGFSYDPSFSMVLPLRDARLKHNQSHMREWIDRLCMLKTEKVMQNGFYDAYWLWKKETIWVKNYIWDTKAMHHSFNPVDQHSLAYMQSVYTREPYHKDEAKDADKVSKYFNDVEALHVYCGLDNCVQLELKQTFKKKLEELGRLQFYLDHYAALFEPLLVMMIGGIRTDDGSRRVAHAKSQVRSIEIQDALEALAGEKLHAKKDLSPLRVNKFLYQTLNLPKQYKGGTKTTDEVALRKLLLYAQDRLSRVNAPRARNRDPLHWQRAIDGLTLLMEARTTSKVRTFIDSRKADKDHYLRCELGFTTEAGRLESKKNPLGTGQNLQNIDRDVRNTFLPDPGHIFLEVDMSQIESRVVYALTRDPKMIELANTKPWEFDQHRYNASRIFRVPEAEVTKEQRHQGKIGVHGAQRGMRGKRLSENLLKQGMVLTAKECDEIVTRYFEEFPAIPDVYFCETRKEVLAHRRLVNSWGRLWDVKFEWFSDDLYRRAYSFVPQSEAADLLNQRGLVPLFWHLQAFEAAHPDMAFPPRLVIQVHDSILVSTPPKYAYELAVFLQRNLEAPRTLTNGVTLSFPVTFKIGDTWAGSNEYNQLPSEEEFHAAASAIPLG
jgi:uracil-DNA glycosylase family 4